jgi:hypothetical protein
LLGHDVWHTSASTVVLTLRRRAYRQEQDATLAAQAAREGAKQRGIISLTHRHIYLYTHTRTHTYICIRIPMWGGWH